MKESKARTGECRQVRSALFEAFDDGRLGGLDQGMAIHLQNCTRCRLEWERLSALAEGLKRSSIPDPGSTYWSNFIPNLRRKMQENLSRTTPDLSWLPSCAMAAGVALLMFLSPARISPPVWWQSEDRLSVANAELSLQEFAALDKALQQDQIQDPYLDETELQFIERLSRSDQTIIEDPLEQLSTMSEDAITKFFERLKSQAIIRS